MSEQPRDPGPRAAPSDDLRPQVEGVDYVIENGLFVLTRSFLLRRGFCCGSGCRNCPYRLDGDDALNKPNSSQPCG